MFTIIIRSQVEEERELLKKMCKEVTAHLSNEKLNLIYDISDASYTPECAIVDICEKEGFSFMKEIRERYPNIEIMLIADAGISPMKYLNPQIRPISLAIKPYEEKEISQVVRDFIYRFLVEDEGAMWIDGPDGKIKIQYKNIMYFEATNKMLSVRLDSVEYIIYGSLEKLEKTLPDSFIRCHRGFIVNHNYISKVRFSENYLVLNSGIQIPLSRTYKQAIRRIINNGQDEKEILS